MIPEYIWVGESAAKFFHNGTWAVRFGEERFE